MRRVVPITALVYAIVAAAPAASSVQPSGFAFGRLGGNIGPFNVMIANSGEVHTSGAVTVGRTKLTSAQLVLLNRVATETTFVKLPTSTNCTGTLPDVAATYVRVGAHTVRVHGNCVPRYLRMWKALVAAVHITQ